MLVIVHMEVLLVVNWGEHGLVIQGCGQALVEATRSQDIATNLLLFQFCALCARDSHHECPQTLTRGSLWTRQFRGRQPPETRHASAMSST